VLLNFEKLFVVMPIKLCNDSSFFRYFSVFAGERSFSETFATRFFRLKQSYIFCIFFKFGFVDLILRHVFAFIFLQEFVACFLYSEQVFFNHVLNFLINQDWRILY
jgi:hypothetical protein